MLVFDRTRLQPGNDSNSILAKRKNAVSPGRPPRANEKNFLSKVTSCDGFWRQISRFSSSHGVSQDDLQAMAEEICRCCWAEANEMMTDESDLVARAKAETDRAKTKLTQCNLSAMKQLTALKVGKHANAELAEDAITFHEPLQFLDEDTRDLVLNIVLEKTRLLDNNRAPPSLIEALTRQANAQAAPKEEAVDPELLRDLRDELEDVRGELRQTRQRLEDADERARKWEGLLAKAEAKAAIAEKSLAEAKEREAKLQKAYEALQQVNAQQQAEIKRQESALEEQRVELKRQREEIERQQAEIQRQQNELARLEGDLERERNANASLRAEVVQLQERLREYVKQVEKLEEQMADQLARFEALEKEANAMREELLRRNNTRTKGTQTTVTGPKLDEQANEIKKLKLMLEELQMKIKELMDKCRRKFGGEVSQIVEELGLKDVMKEETVFQRLYDDAMDRVHRLEKLRDKVRKQRCDAYPPGAAGVSADFAGATACAASPGPSGARATAPAEGFGNIHGSPATQERPVLAEIEESELPGLKRFAREAQQRLDQEQTRMLVPSPLQPAAATASARGFFARDVNARTPRVHDRGCGDSHVMGDSSGPPLPVPVQARKMKSSSSLPALATPCGTKTSSYQPGVSVCVLDLGGGCREVVGGSRRRRLKA
eukprot:TRINITY_DN35208_c0_g5_i1.p1 TRINITY_DN35208_c0_g5~~TRINITY_DN35208_c0_g5_i1.p1  ORF type:complete len:663 (+),score=165.89 TRINITY_DN35208_c0_g5_i1:126-2114(+)